MNDPRNILAHARNIMMEQIIHCCGGNDNRRKELNDMSDEQLRQEWQRAIGDPAEEVGV